MAMINSENRDYKYVMQDMGQTYIGSKYTYDELIAEEDIPFKLKVIVQRYLLTKMEGSVTLESHFYHMEPIGFEYETYKQLKTSIKYSEWTVKKNLLGKSKGQYITRVLPIDKFTKVSVEEKKKKGIVIQEISISKLGLMTFTT